MFSQLKLPWLNGLPHTVVMRPWPPWGNLITGKCSSAKFNFNPLLRIFFHVQQCKEKPSLAKMQNLGSTPSQGVQSQPVIQIMTPKNCRGEEQSQLTLLGYHYPKPDKDITKKRKLEANSTSEHRHKNPQQNTSKQNLIIHQNDHTPWSNGI